MEPPIHSDLVLSVGFSLHAFTTLILSARLLVAIKLRKFGLADVLIVLVWGISLFLLICSTLDRHQLNPILSPQTTILLFTSAFSLTQASIICFYLSVTTELRCVVIGRIGLSVITVSTATTIFLPLWCRTRTFYYVAGLNTVVPDVLLCVVLARGLIVWQLRDADRARMVVLFITGLLVVALAGVTMWKSVTSNIEDYMLWAIVKLHVAVAMACLPGVKLFLMWIRGGERDASSSSGGGSCGGMAELGGQKGSGIDMGEDGN